MARSDYYGVGNHEAASKFLGQIIFRLNIQQRRQPECNRLVSSKPVRSAKLSLASEADEETIGGPPAGRILRLGSNQVDAQGDDKERGRSRRLLCFDRENRQWRTGLFDEVRKLARAAATAATGRKHGGAAAGARVPAAA